MVVYPSPLLTFLRFPYPKVGVAELDPPRNGQTFWNFDDIRPQFEAFMRATSGHTSIPNFSTQPTWMYDTPVWMNSNISPQFQDWSYPQDPNDVDWSYPRGNANANTTQLVAEYYGRLISWMTKGTKSFDESNPLGSFVDEFGVHHTGGYKFPISHWEVYNEPEGCHGLNYKTYTQQFDAIVKEVCFSVPRSHCYEVRRVADPNKRIKFVGLALAGREMDWISYFLDHR